MNAFMGTLDHILSLDTMKKSEVLNVSRDRADG
jgi:hypothetical protein